MTITVSYHLLNQDGWTFRISWKIIDNVKSCYSGNGWIVCAFPRYTNKQSVYLEVLQLLVQFKCATPPLPQDVPRFSVLTIFFHIRFLILACTAVRVYRSFWLERSVYVFAWWGDIHLILSGAAHVMYCEISLLKKSLAAWQNSHNR